MEFYEGSIVVEDLRSSTGSTGVLSKILWDLYDSVKVRPVPEGFIQVP